MASEAEKIILREINRISGPRKTTTSNIEICCPFHSERTPSCGIYVVPNGKVPFGYFYCFGCGEKGPWNRLAKRLGLQEVDNSSFRATETGVNEAEMQRKRDSLLPSRERVEMPYGLEFNDDRWRGIDGDLVREVGGVLGYDAHEKISCLYLPVRVSGTLVSVIKARLKKAKGRLSYIYVGGNAGIKRDGLYPYDHTAKMLGSGRYRHVVLVEGPRDALRLIDKGIPALAILGTNMWSAHKRRRVLGLCASCDVTPIVMMDADRVKQNGVRPGQAAQRTIVRDLGPYISVEQIRLQRVAERLGLEELDPATLPLSLYREIRELVTRPET